MVSKSNNVTCDFDLIDEGYDILSDLPAACKEAAEDPELRAAMKAEAMKFKQFMTDLDNKESATGYEVDEEDEDIRIPIKDWHLRTEIYTDAELFKCSDETFDDNAFIECISRKRDEMIAAVISD